MPQEDPPRRAFVEVDLATVKSSAELLQRLGEHLGLYLYNDTWHSLWDSICTADMPERLVIYGMDHVDDLYPHEADLLRGALRVGLEGEIENPYVYELNGRPKPAA